MNFLKLRMYNHWFKKMYLFSEFFRGIDNKENVKYFNKMFDSVPTSSFWLFAIVAMAIGAIPFGIFDGEDA